MENKKPEPSVFENMLWVSSIICPFFGLFILLSNSVDKSLSSVGVFLIIFGILMIFPAFSVRKARINRKPYVHKPVEEMTEKEKKDALVALEILYKRGEIPSMAYDIQKSKLMGTKSFAEMVGFENAFAINQKIDVDKAIQKKAKENERAVILGSAIGNGIGGLGGSIVGAASAAIQGNEEMEQLLQQKAAAEALLDKAEFGK